MISALDGVGGQRHAPAAFTPGKEPLPIVQEAGWASGPVWTGAKNLAPPGFDPRTAQPVGSRYTDYATRPTQVASSFLKFKSNVLIKRDFFLSNAASTMVILDLISHVHPPSFVKMLLKYLKHSTLSSFHNNTKKNTKI